MMSTRMTRGTLIGVWFAMLAAFGGSGAIWGVSITIGTRVFLLAAALVPPAIMLMLWGGAPLQTVAELLHPVDRDA